MLISARVWQIKSEPEIYRIAAQRLEPTQLLFLDDLLDNVLAARQAGWQALRFVDARQAEVQMLATGRPLTGTRFLSHWRFESAGW
jgi:FMN phosphatase YigB (HAD superfamily)